MRWLSPRRVDFDLIAKDLEFAETRLERNRPAAEKAVLERIKAHLEGDTDIQKGFIRAEIIGYDDLVAAGGETAAKHANKMRVETKTYVMQDYDVVNFRFNKK